MQFAKNLNDPTTKFSYYKSKQMKNIIKPLEWLEAQDDDDDYEAPLESGLGSYYIFKAFDKYHLCLGDNGGGGGWNGDHYETLEEAKAACQKHYDEMILESLTDEARTILEQNFNLQTKTT